MPKILERCVMRVMENPDFKPRDGQTKQEAAHAVCIANFQKTGMMKPGSTDLTEKGKTREAELMAAGSAIIAMVGALTFDDVEQAIRDALSEKFDSSASSASAAPSSDYAYLEDVSYLDNLIVYRRSGKNYKTSFQLNQSDMSVTIGEPVEVVETWVEASSDYAWKGPDGTLLIAMTPLVAAVWSTAMINDLPDSAFLYVESGTKDASGLTTPRSLRHFPYKGKDGTVDLAHLRNALARIPQSSLPQAVKDRVTRKAQRIAKANGIDTGGMTAAATGAEDGLSGDTPAHFLRFPLVSRAGRGQLIQKELVADRGISVLMDGITKVEMLFDTRAPHTWTVADAKKWLSRPFICASASRAEVIADATPDLPMPVADAIARLKANVPPLSPFVIRVKGTVGKFEAQSGKVNFTPDFYRKYGPAFVGKPYYLGHVGFDSADYRQKIGQIIHFEYPAEGEPRWYINVSEGQDAIRKSILEEQALGVSAERTGASSIEGWASQTEDRDGDGFLEPTAFHAGGIAMVRQEAATGTTIDKIIH